MLATKEGRLGYYPITNYAEWEELEDLYKVMEWNTVSDPYDKDIRRTIKSVVFDVVYMEPYKINAKVFVHPQDVLKILCCYYGKTECHLYSICEVELEGGTRLPAKWVQDSSTGSFAIIANGQFAAIQGDFNNYIPKCMEELEDGSYKYNWNHNTGKTYHYTYMNPFENVLEKDSTNRFINAMIEFAKDNKWKEEDVVEVLEECGIVKEDLVKVGYSEIANKYFRDEKNEIVINDEYER